MLVFPNKEKAAMLVTQTDPPGISSILIQISSFVSVKNMAADHVSGKALYIGSSLSKLQRSFVSCHAQDSLLLFKRLPKLACLLSFLSFCQGLKFKGIICPPI